MSRKRAILWAIVICVIVMVAAPVYAAKARITWTAGGTGGGWFVDECGPRPWGVEQRAVYRIPTGLIRWGKFATADPNRVMGWSELYGRGKDPQALTLATERKPSRLVELAKPFVSEYTNWLVLLGVGKIADFMECGVHGVINAVAVHCMVGVAIDASLPLLRNTYPDTPIITLTYGGTKGPGQRVRLETFVHTVLEHSKRSGGVAEGTSQQ